MILHYCYHFCWTDQLSILVQVNQVLKVSNSCTTLQVRSPNQWYEN